MKQQVTLALSLTLAAGLLAGCADTTGGSQPTGAAQTSPADGCAGISSPLLTACTNKCYDK